jgi:hypothetical protein
MVFLTGRGWQVRETILAVATEVEVEWALVLGKKRFDEFMNTLRQLWSIQQSDIQGAGGLDAVRQDGRSATSLRERSRKPSKNR